MDILIVDDSEINRKLLRVVLQAEEYNTVEAADGREALQVLERENVDVIVSDILMPNMDGYRLCYEVRKSERLKAIPFIVFTSTYNSAKDEKLALSFGADRFIRRPAPASEILKAIQDVTSRAEQPAIPSLEPSEEAAVMKAYSERLVIKLEEKNVEIQRAYTKLLESNRDLRTRTRQLEASEEKFRGIFENILDVFFRTNHRGRIQLVSPSIQRYGYLPTELIGTNIRSLVADPADRDRVIDLLTDPHLLQRREITLRRKEGKPFVVAVNVRLLTDQQGSPAGIEGTLHDITERKSLEAQLLQAQKLESIGRLAGGIAHDFNNLLTIVMGSAELAEDEIEEDHPSRVYLQNVIHASERAANLTHQLLAFARKQVIAPKIVSLNDLILHTGAMLRRLLGEDVGLVTLPRPDLGLVKVDVGQMEQVLVNMAVNSRDAMPEGGKLTIETDNVTLDEEYARQHVEVAPGEYVMMAVSDTGIGMDKAIQAQLFEPFFTTKEVGKGTGLGLATCYGIVKQSGGHIWVYSEPGQGATFKVYLPRVEEPADDLPARVEPGDLPRGAETVLLVEDDTLVRAIVIQVLSAQGYRVLEAANGQEALRVAAEYPEAIDLLVTDVVMPQMGGKALAGQLAAVRPGTKVLYTSGYTDNAVIHHGVLDSGVEYLQKPFTPGVLAHKVREVLDSRR